MPGPWITGNGHTAFYRPAIPAIIPIDIPTAIRPDMKRLGNHWHVVVNSAGT